MEEVDGLLLALDEATGAQGQQQADEDNDDDLYEWVELVDPETGALVRKRQRKPEPMTEMELFRTVEDMTICSGGPNAALSYILATENFLMFSTHGSVQSMCFTCVLDALLRHASENQGRLPPATDLDRRSIGEIVLRMWDHGKEKFYEPFFKQQQHGAVADQNAERVTRAVFQLVDLTWPSQCKEQLNMLFVMIDPTQAYRTICVLHRRDDLYHPLFDFIDLIINDPERFKDKHSPPRGAWDQLCDPDNKEYSAHYQVVVMMEEMRACDSETHNNGAPSHLFVFDAEEAAEEEQNDDEEEEEEEPEGEDL